MRFFTRVFLFVFLFFAAAGMAKAAPPATPTNLNAWYYTSSGLGLVGISWTDNANDETGFQLFRKLSTDSSWPSSHLMTYGPKTTVAPSTFQSNDPNANLPAGTYDYKVRACNSSGECSDYSNVASVIVGSSSSGGGSGSDTTPPSMPSNFSAASATIGQINLSWGASSDNVGVAGYKIYRCYGAYDCSSPSYFASVGSSATSYSDTSVYSGMAYRYYVVAHDQAGNYSSQTQQILIIATSDTAPPSAPSNLTASASSGTQISLAWGASSDNVGVSQYAIYRNSSYLGYTTSCCGYIDNLVTAGATYTYYAIAYDARGNISQQSNTVTITAPSGTSSSSGDTTTYTDTTAPVWPLGYTYGTSILSSSSIRINWTAASDAVGVSGYKIYRNGTQITTTTLLEYTDSGLVPSTAYNYSIAAYDAAGNVSTQINFSPATTWSDTSNNTSTSTTPTTDTTAPIITNARAENIMGSGAQIKWSTDDSSNSRAVYGLSSGNLLYLADNRCDGTGYVTSHCINLTDLVQNTVYYYKVKSLNSAGLDAESPIYQFTSASSTPAGDTTPPAPPASVSSYAVSASSISISWSGAVDPTVSGQTASGVSGYKIYRNGTYLSTSSSLSYSDSGLSPSTNYYYTIAAVDGAGNVSGMSASTNATTMASTDTPTSASYSSVSGKVADATGTAVPGVNVYFSSSDRYYSAITDSAGRYSLTSVYPAGYNVKVYSPSGTAYQPISKTVTLAAGQTMALDFQFAASSKMIKGKISYSDGRPVANAGIGAHNLTSGAWTSGYVNEQGVFSLQVSGGKWQVNIYPKSGTGQMNDWSYTDSPREISFKDDASTEETSIDFIVKGAQVSVKGYVFLPDGSAPSAGIASVSLRGSSGFENRFSIDSSGMFSAYLTADTYKGEIFSTDSRYGGIEIAAFSAVSGVVDLGKFYLKSYSEKIKGAVKDSSGNPVAGVWVNVNNYTTGKYAQSKSSENGSFEVSVSAGEWSVQVYADPMFGYSYNQPPKFITVSSGGAAEANFVMTKNDARISGNIVDANGQVISDAYGYISTYVPSSATMMMYAAPSFGGQIEKGSFSFNLPAGTYTLNANFSSNSGYIPPEPQTVTVATGETKKINLAIAKTDVALSGFLKDDAGNIVKGLGDDKVKVYLSAKGGAWHNAKIDASTGSFSAQISAGIWYLGYWAESSSGYVSSGKDVEINVAAGESKKIDIALLKANSIISGTVKTSDGTALSNVWISVNTRSLSAMSGSTSMTYGSSYIGGVSSDGSGKFEIKVPPGKYFIQSSYTMTSGYLNPPEIETTVASGQTASVEIVFRKPDATLSGVAYIDGKGAPAYIWAWRESGGYVSARADDYGKYSFAVSRNSKWRVAASYEKNGIYYKTADVVVEIGDQTAMTQDLTLLSLVAIPNAVEKVVETAKQQSLELQNGAKVVLPANSLATSGSANVVIKPEVEVLSTGATSVVGTGYRVEAKDEKGQGITNLNAEITISIPYDEADLAAKGLRPEDLTLSFFDETTQTWKQIEKQVVDKENKTVSAMVNHLTLFALIAPADTTPPSAPNSVAVSPVADNGVHIAWKNPAADFHHAKIYRSSQKGTPGDVIFNYITGESKTDPNGNSSHFYMIRAVDLAGNESANAAQYQTGMSAVPEEIATQSTVTIPTTQSGILLVRVKDDPKVYAVENGKKRWIKSLEEFNAAGYKWSEVTLIGVAQLTGYPDQSTALLVRVKDDPKVYAVENGKKRWIKSLEEFNAAGYKWSEVTLIGVAQLTGYTDQGMAFKFSSTLKLGSRGEAVRQLQTLLARDKSIYPQGLATGYYGSLTQAAVVRFQAKYKINDQKGSVGAETIKKLNEQ